MGKAKRRRRIGPSYGSKSGRSRASAKPPQDATIQGWLTSPQVSAWVCETLTISCPEWQEMMKHLLQELLEDKSHDHIIHNLLYRTAVGVNVSNWSLWAGFHENNIIHAPDCPYTLATFVDSVEKRASKVSLCL